MTSHKDQESASRTDSESTSGSHDEPAPIDSEDALPFPWIGVLLGIALFVVALLTVLEL